jgi:hypothetical protein
MRDVEEGHALAREAANRALALAAGLTRRRRADLAWIANAYDRDLPRRVRHMERALALDPGAAARALLNGRSRRASLGRLELAEPCRSVRSRDPANPTRTRSSARATRSSGATRRRSRASQEHSS